MDVKYKKCYNFSISKFSSVVSAQYPTKFLNLKVHTERNIMGKSNIKVKQFLRDKKRFADLFNGTIFDGEQVIKPEELEEVDSETSIVVTDKNNTPKGVQRYRDIAMIWKKGIKLAILACENQNKIHYAMPVRMMLYDGLTYTDQIRQIWQNREPDAKLTEEEFLSRFRKEDKIYPVISLVFYYGLEKWDASRDLYEMFQQNKLLLNEDVLKKYVPNYSLNLIDVSDIGEVERFQTDLQLILGMLQYKNEIDNMRNYVNAHQAYFRSIDTETYQAIGELLHSEKKMNVLVTKSEEKGRMNMCKALDDLYNSGVTAGIEQGICALIEVCKEIGLSKEDIILKIKEKFSVSEEKAKEYMEKYNN